MAFHAETSDEEKKRHICRTRPRQLVPGVSSSWIRLDGAYVRDDLEAFQVEKLRLVTWRHVLHPLP